MEFFLKQALAYLSGKSPEIDTKKLVDDGMKAMQSGGKGALMTMAESYAKKHGYESAFVNNQLWNGLKSIPANEVVPYVMKAAKDMGIMGMINSLMGNNDVKPQQKQWFA